MGSHSLVAFRETQNTDPSQSPGFLFTFSISILTATNWTKDFRISTIRCFGWKKICTSKSFSFMVDRNWILHQHLCPGLGVVLGGVVCCGVSQDEQLERVSHETRGRQGKPQISWRFEVFLKFFSGIFQSVNASFWAYPRHIHEIFFI